MCPFEEGHSISQKKSSKGGKKWKSASWFYKAFGQCWEKLKSRTLPKKNKKKIWFFFLSKDFGKKDITFIKFRLFSLIMLAWRLFLEENVDLASRLCI